MVGKHRSRSVFLLVYEIRLRELSHFFLYLSSQHCQKKKILCHVLVHNTRNKDFMKKHT